MIIHTSPDFTRRVALVAIVLAVAAAGASIVLADPGSPITITNVDGPDPVSSGQQLAYTITMVNTGGAKLTELVMTSQYNGLGGIGVPPQLQLTSTRGACSQNANLVTCTTAQVEGGGTWVVTVRGLVNAANGTTINNTASVTGTRSAQNFTSTATTTTLVTNTGGDPLPDLNVAKAGPTSIAINTPMAYTLLVNNIGTANADEVKVVDTVPAGVTGITASGTSLFTCGVVGQTVTCTGGRINQGSNATITINGTSPAAVGTITNTASVDPDNTIAEANELNNTSALVNTQVTPGPEPPKFLIIKTDDPAILPGAGPDPVVPGGTITYKILVTNNNGFRADDVVVIDGTQGLVAASVQADQVITNGTVGNFGGCVVTAPEVRCSIRTLDPGGTMLVTVSGQVISSAGTTIFNTATVTGNIRNIGYSSTDTELTTVKPAVDLTLTKDDSPDPVCARSWPGAVPAPPVCRGGLTYNFVVGNSGIETATGVTVRDPLPPGTHFDSFNAPAFSGGCAVDGSNVVTCTGGTINPESTTPVSFVLVAPPGVGPIVNTAYVDPNNAIFEADETNNTATETTQVITGIDLTVVKVDSAPGFDPVATNGTQTWTITVNNQGTQNATGIRVRDVLPSGAIFRSAIGDNGFTCGHQDGVVECAGGAILGTASEFYPPFGAPGDDTATITIRAFARAFEGAGVDAMHNEVRVDPDNTIAEADEANNFEFEDTDVGSGGAGMGAFNQLTILKEQISPANNVARNAVVEYKLTIGNDATDPVVGVEVHDFPPAGSRYIEATGTNEFQCVEGEGEIACTGGVIAAGGSATITIHVFAPDTPGTYINQSIVDPNEAIPEGNEFDNQFNVTTIVENGGNDPYNDLLVDKTGTPETTPGGVITYSLLVSNIGSNVALNVAVRDVLPAGVVFISAEDAAPGSPGAFTCSHAAGVIDCTGGTLNPGVPRSITIEATAPNDQVMLTNQAFIDPDNAIPEGDEENNTDTHDTLVRPLINLSIQKTGPTTSSQSQPGEYVITMKNNISGGGQRAENVVMRDPLPVGLIPLAAEIDPGQENNWACQILQNPINLVECVGDLDPDQTVVVRVAVFMTAESGKSLDNEACIDPDNVIEEFGPGETDNCSTWTTVIVPKSPNLFLNKSASPSAVTPGAELVYTLLLQNNGDASAASPLTVTDNLPSSLTFVDANGTDGWTCSFSAPTVTCQDAGGGLAVGASVTLTIRTTVNTGVTLPISNAANATSPATTTDVGAVNETADHLADNTATVTTSVTGSGFDLVLSVLTDNPDPVSPGQVLKYTAVAVNGGTEAAIGVKVAIEIPSGGVLFLNADGTNGFNCAAPVSNVITCTGDLPGGGDTTISVGLAVLLSLVPPADLSVTATVDPPDAAHPNGFFAESNEGNNDETEVTTVTGSACVQCADLVTTQLTASPGYTGLGVTTQTFTAQVVNVGDTATSLNPATDTLLEFVVYAQTGTFSVGAPTLSDPAFVPLCTITTIPLAAPLTQVKASCKGNLGPSQGLTLTIPVSSVTGDLVSYIWADPFNLVNGTSTPPEFREDNNILIITVFHF